MAGGGQEPGLGRRGVLGHAPGLVQSGGAVGDARFQPFVGLFQLACGAAQGRDVGIAGRIAAAGNGGARGSQHPAVGLLAFMVVGDAAAQRLQPSLDPGLDIVGALAALGVQAIDDGDGQADVDEADGQVEHGDVAPVPGGDAQILVHHDHALVDVVQRGLQQIAVELNGLRRLVQHPHHVLGRAPHAGQRRRDDPPGRGRADGARQHPLGGARQGRIGRIGVAQLRVGLIAPGGEGALGPFVADEAGDQGAQVADRGARRRGPGLHPVRSQTINEGAGLDPVDQPGLGKARHADIGRQVQSQADEDAQGQRILDTQHHIQMPGRVGRQLGQGQHDDPYPHADTQTRQRSLGMAAAPKHRAEQGGRQLGHRREGHQTHRRQTTRLVGRLIIEPGQQQHRDDGPAPHLKDGARHVGRIAPHPPAIPRQEGQDQAVGHHGRQGDGLDDHHGGGGREAADEDHGGQQGLAALERQGQDQQIRVHRGREQGARRHQRQHRQTGQQQIEGKDPARPLHVRRLGALHEGDMELTRQAKDGQGRQQGDGGEARRDLGRRGQGAQPLDDTRRRTFVQQQGQGEDGDEQQGAQLDHRLQADGLDQAAIVLGQVRAARAEQDGEEGQHPRQHQHRQPLGPRDRRAGGQKGAGHRQRFQLKRDIGQRPQDGDDRDGRAQGLALAVARGHEVGHRADVLAPGGGGDAAPQREQQGQAEHRPDIDGQILPPVPRRRADRAIIGP